MNKTNNLCNNCGKYGHLFYHCKLPITSYGIILFRQSSEGPRILMIRRKDSFGYIDFIRGKYSPYNIEQLQKSVDEMSNKEKYRILNEPFTKLWKMLWGENSATKYCNEEQISQKKFDAIRNGVLVEDKLITLENIVANSTTTWDETEWEFPKGRRNFQEKDLDCALREFEEETGLSQEDIFVIDNLLPFEEIYIGSNHKCYKHKYFLAYTNKNDESVMNFQKNEVSKLEWKLFDECLQSIRPYNLEKKKLIMVINQILHEYQLWQ